MKYYQQQLIDKGIKQSFSRKGNCIKESMIEYIDYYNNKRMNLKRKGLTPIEFRNMSLDKCIIN